MLIFSFEFYITTKYLVFSILLRIILSDIVKVFSFSKIVKNSLYIFIQETLKAVIAGIILVGIEIFIRSKSGNIYFRLDSSLIQNNYLINNGPLVLAFFIALFSWIIRTKFYEKITSFNTSQENEQKIPMGLILEHRLKNLEIQKHIKGIFRDKEVINKILSKIVFYNVLVITYIVGIGMLVGESYFFKNITAQLLFISMITANYSRIYLSSFSIIKEGNMVKRYVLAGFRLNSIVLNKVIFNSLATGLSSSIPAFSLCLFLSNNYTYLFWTLILVSSYSVVLTIIGEYYRILGAQYLTDIISQDKISTIKNIALETVLISTLIYGSVIMNLLEITDVFRTSVIFFVLVNIVLSFLYYYKIKKDRKEYYGEYAEAIR